MKNSTPGLLQTTQRFAFWPALPITLLMVLAALLYLYQLGTESLWVDELFSIRDANQPLPEILQGSRPLYYLLLRFWMRLGTSEAWLRSLSVLFGLSSVLFIYQLGKRLDSQAVGLIAALLFTLSPLIINHTQEVRMYILSVCLGLGGTLLLSSILDQQQKALWLLAWLGLRLLAILSTPLNLLLLLADMVLFGIRFREQGWRLWQRFKYGFLLLGGVLVFTTGLPLFHALPQFLAHKTGSTPPGISAFVGGLTRFTIWPLKSPIETLAWFYDPFFNVYALILIALLAVAILKGIIGSQPAGRHILWLTVWGFLPLMSIFIISQFATTLWGVDRYLLFTIPYILILLAIGFMQVWMWRRSLALIIVAIYGIAVGSSLFYYYTVPNREDWRGATQIISRYEQPGDVILLGPPYFSPAIDYYYKGSTPVFTVDFFEPTAALIETALQQKVDRLPVKAARLWLVLRFFNVGEYKEQQILLNAAIRKHFIVENQYITGDGANDGVEVFLMRPDQNYPQNN